MVRNLADIYTFLSPILPTVEETTRTIECYKEKDAEQQPTEQETEQEQEQNSEQTQQEQTQTTETNEPAEDDENIREVRWDLTNLPEKEQNREQQCMDQDKTTYQAPDVRQETQVTERIDLEEL